MDKQTAHQIMLALIMDIMVMRHNHNMDKRLHLQLHRHHLHLTGVSSMRNVLFTLFIFVYLFITDPAIQGSMCTQQAANMLVTDQIRHEFRPWYGFKALNTGVWSR